MNNLFFDKSLVLIKQEIASPAHGLPAMTLINQQYLHDICSAGQVSEINTQQMETNGEI